MKYFVRIVGIILGTLRAEYRQLANRYFGKHGRYDGDAISVCEQSLEKLWSGEFYRTSLGHFDFFWTRDFGTACQSLVHLGYTEQVHRTLQFALRHFRRAGAVTLCIDKHGNCFDAPNKSIDTLPWLLHSLVVSDYPLNKSDVKFLNRALRKYRDTYLDTHGYLRSMKVYEMRDAVIYDRSAYAVSLVARLAECARLLGLQHSYSIDLYRDQLIGHYWNGKYFNADYRNDAFSAECALLPFWLGIIDDREMAEATFAFIAEKKLSDPYPLIYTPTPERFNYHWWMSAPWMPNYHGNIIWSWHGEFYLHLLRRYKHPRYAEEYQKFCDMITLHGNFPELLNTDGSWYNAPVYRGDPGMIWVALFLELPAPHK